MPVSRLVLVAINIPLIAILLVVFATQPAEGAAPSTQPAATWTAQPVLTVMPEPESTPTATATSTPKSGGIHHPVATPTPQPTAPPAATATPIPTVPIVGG